MKEIIEPWKENVLLKNEISISDFNFSAIIRICNYLDIDTEFHTTSVGITERKLNEGIQDITKHFNDNHYINAIGGQSLYYRNDFESVGLKLNFIQMKDLDVDNPYLSILDLLFRYDKEHLKKQLNKYELI
jgi:hypothetical protein